MTLGEITSKTLRSSKTGFLFFLLMQMSLLCVVRPQDPITAASTTSSSSSSSSASSSSSSSSSQSASTGLSSSTGQTTSMATSVSSVTATSFSANTSANSTLLSGNSTDNATTGNFSMTSCPAFVCTSDCYNQYINTTAKPCPLNSNFCEITIKSDASYSVGCSNMCGMSCGNTTLSNCTVSCCNTTNCLYNTVRNISNPYSTAATTSSSTTTTTKTTAAATPANNGKKCSIINCNGAACYKTAQNTPNFCPVGQDYCMLKKTVSGTTENWEAGCSTDCRKMTACSTSVTGSCYLECCNATASTCLKLTGDVNMPSSATRGPQSPALLITSILLFWIVRVF
ncbi:uncharacterized protein DDB_G0271670 [Danio aesculapii]|uniref:uncharacterized protein DDB_G0271670 n=1 Tax=Danio aesculapii TaxID=1142201 RepID=UPI0024BFCB0B|nr:uncharacterized protein DDB_G0271670 [Danio aesculapii]